MSVRILLIVSLTFGPARGQADDPWITECVAKWNEHPALAGASFVACRRLRLHKAFPGIALSPSHEEFQQFLGQHVFPLLDDQNVQPAELEAQIDAATMKFTMTEEGERRLGLSWSDFELSHDGVQLRNESFSQTADGQTVTRTLLRTKEGEIDYSSDIGQATVRSNNSQFRSIVPEDIFLPSKLVRHVLEKGKFKTVIQTDRRVNIIYEGAEIVVEMPGFALTGFRLAPSGRQIQEIHRLGRLLEHPAVVVPRLIANVRSEQVGETARVSSADILITKAVDLNADLPIERFRLFVPKGTVIVDFVSATEKWRNRALRTEEDVADARRYLRANR